jgi:hypothetical protein
MKTQNEMAAIMKMRLATAEGTIAEGNLSDASRIAAVGTANALISFACAADIFTMQERIEWSGRIVIAKNYAMMRKFQLMKEEIERERENAVKVLNESHCRVAPRVDATPSWMQGLPVEMD